MNTYKTISDYSFLETEYNYQPDLTKKLDNCHDRNVDQEFINEIVLWKINRYAQLDTATLDLLNKIDTTSKTISADLIRTILEKLLKTKGIRLPMASTILRFRNPNVFQIIDQRAYRFVYGVELKSTDTSTDKTVSSQIDLYLKYLQDLKMVEEKTGWAFSQLDRILYIRDQQLNKNINIK